MSVFSPSRMQWIAREIIPHEPDLRRWLATRLPPSDVDDVVQESYAILAGMQAVDHIAAPRNYLFTVAKSVMLKSLRKGRVVEMDRFAEAESLQVPCDRPGPEVVVADRQELKRLGAMIEQLPLKCRQAFVLRKLHGLSQRQVAAEMGISENTVEKHMAKAIILLSGAIGRGGNRRLATSLGDDRIADPAWGEVVGGSSSERH